MLLSAVFLGVASSSKPKGWFEVPQRQCAVPADQARRDEFVASLVGNMTVEEKAAQLYMLFARHSILHDSHVNRSGLARFFHGDVGVGVIHDMYAPGQHNITETIQRYAMESTRMGIPVLFVEEGLHGVAEPGKTVFPQPLALASTFDKDLAHRVARVVGREARAYGIVELFAPVLGLAWEPRWGRSGETLGEDRHLTSRLAVEVVLGLQGGADGSRLSDNDTVVSEPKHFQSHSVPEAGHNAGPVHMGRRERLTQFLAPFEAAVVEGGARGIMAAYSETDSIPNCADEWSLTQVLRDAFGFRGWVLSDDGAVSELFNRHAVAATPADSVVTFMEAGGAVSYYDYPQNETLEIIANCSRNGSLPLDVLDARVSELLSLKHELGLFETPFRDVNALVDARVDTPEARALAEEAATRAVVLLKNDAPTTLRAVAPDGTAVAGAAAPVLPLPPGSRLLVTGPSADVVRTGDYSGAGLQSNFVTVLDALRNATAARGGSVTFRPGCHVQSPAPSPVLVPVRPAYWSVVATGGAPGPPGVNGSYFQPGTSPASPGAAPAFTRTDAAVDFDWFVYGPDAYTRTRDPTSGSPGSIAGARFAARWEGFVTPPATADGVLGVDAMGDPVRVLVDGKTVIDTFPADGAARGRPRCERDAAAVPAMEPGVSCAEACACAVARVRGAAEASRLFPGVIPARRCKGPTRVSAERLVAAAGGAALSAHHGPCAAIGGAAPVTAVPFSFAEGKPLRVTVEYDRRQTTRAGVQLQWTLVPGAGLDEDAGIAAAAAAARGADAAVVVLGEDDATVGEGIDSDSLLLPGRQADLIAAIAATGTPVVAVVMAGRPVAIPAVAGASSAVLFSLFNGQAAGTGFARVMFNEASPSGRLPVSLPVDVGQVPVHYTQKPSGGQVYQNGPSKPLFPFGWGLGYSSFEASIVGTAPAAPTAATEQINVTVRLTNNGSTTASHVLQLYARDVVASVTTPVQQLVAFERVADLRPGATAEVVLGIDVRRELSVIDRQFRRVVEPGMFRLWLAECGDISLCQASAVVEVELGPADA